MSTFRSLFTLFDSICLTLIPMIPWLSPFFNIFVMWLLQHNYYLAQAGCVLARLDSDGTHCSCNPDWRTFSL